MPSTLNPPNRQPFIEDARSSLTDEVGRSGGLTTSAPTGWDDDGAHERKPVFRELMRGSDSERGDPSDSQLWEARSGRREDAQRLTLRSFEAVLSPTTGAAVIINAVAFAMSSQGLRLVERDSFRIRGQRIEASFLSNQPREEWRVVEARLGISRGFPSWVLLVEFKTDPCPKQSRGAAALASVAEKLGSTGNTGAAVAMAHRRSDGRARSLVEAISGELGRLDGAAQPDGIDESGEGTDDVVLAPFEGGGVDPEVRDGSGSGNASTISETLRHKEVEVRLCLQFVEGLCARAEEYSKRDAQETWRPLEHTIRRLEGENEKLCSLLESKYRAVGVAPPSVPTWFGWQGLGDRSGSQAVENEQEGGTSMRVAEVLRGNPFFSVEGAWVKARVLTGPKCGSKHGNGPQKEGNVAPAAASESQHPPPSPIDKDPQNCFAAASIEGVPEDSPVAGPSAGISADARRYSVLVLSVVKVLGEWIGGVCEAREEGSLKARLPAAQSYVEKLENYQSSFVGGAPLRMAAGPSRGDVGTGGPSVEVDDDLFRFFGAVETRLYSSSAALGKKPGRIYLTFKTLWFHSRVLGFESRLILPLAKVQSVALLGTALDLSSSLVVMKKDGGELMLVFPGQRMAALQPLQILIRQLAVLAAKEAQEDA